MRAVPRRQRPQSKKFDKILIFYLSRYDACVELVPELKDRAIRDFGITTLQGGAYACRRLSGSYAHMHSVVANVYSEFEALPGLAFDSNRPVFPIYIDNPNRFAENELRADICVPVMVVGNIVRSRKSLPSDCADEVPTPFLSGRLNHGAPKSPP